MFLEQRQEQMKKLPVVAMIGEVNSTEWAQRKSDIMEPNTPFTTRNWNTSFDGGSKSSSPVKCNIGNNGHINKRLLSPIKPLINRVCQQDLELIRRTLPNISCISTFEFSPTSDWRQIVYAAEIAADLHVKDRAAELPGQMLNFGCVSKRRDGSISGLRDSQSTYKSEEISPNKDCLPTLSLSLALTWLAISNIKACSWKAVTKLKQVANHDDPNHREYNS